MPTSNLENMKTKKYKFVTKYRLVRLRLNKAQVIFIIISKPLNIFWFEIGWTILTCLNYRGASFPKIYQKHYGVV